MMDEQEALAIISGELDQALDGVRAPARFAAEVRMRTGVSKRPEFLDMVGWTGVLAMACALQLYFGPREIGVDWFVPAGVALMAVALCVGVYSLRELAD